MSIKLDRFRYLMNRTKRMLSFEEIFERIVLRNLRKKWIDHVLDKLERDNYNKIILIRISNVKILNTNYTRKISSQILQRVPFLRAI